MIKAPEYILSVKPYVPGKPIEELERELGIKGSVKLASNENPLGPSKLALESIKDSLEALNRYPDGSGYYLKEKLSRRLGIKPECIILGNGSNELLDIAVRTFMSPGDDAVMAAPSFVVYPSSTRIQGANPIEVPLRDWKHDLAGMGQAVTPKTKIVFIANPNNPTGTANTETELSEFLSGLRKDILVILDEAYYEYVTDPAYARSMEHFRKGENVLILRTFSKIYGLAGLRIGYGITHPDVVLQMERVRPPFNTGTVSQAAALAALDDKEHVEKSVLLNNEGKKFLYEEFAALGLPYVPTEANFIYLPVENSFSLYESLLREGVIIRPMGPRAVRITIGLPNENERLIRSLKKILNK
jgi:histidinol-phosphate aminotransferase